MTTNAFFYSIYRTPTAARKDGILLPSRWNTAESHLSLEALLETPGFGETNFRSLGAEDATKTPRTKLSREEERRKPKPDDIRKEEERLWREIDEEDAKTAIGKKGQETKEPPKEPPRGESYASAREETNHPTHILYEKAGDAETKETHTPLDPSLIATAADPVKVWGLLRPELQTRLHSWGIGGEQLCEWAKEALSYTHNELLRHKKRLLDLRRQQYGLKDLYTEMTVPLPSLPQWETYRGFDDILPLRLPQSHRLFEKLYDGEWPYPAKFTEEEQKQISELLWEKHTEGKEVFDFTDEKHLLAFIRQLRDIEIEAQEEAADGILKELWQIWSTFRKLANLGELLETILELEIDGVPNKQIQEEINLKFNKDYRENYISTLFRQRIIGGIASTAKRFKEVLGNVFFEENFKVCRDCGRTLLMDEENFMRRSRVANGFSPRCKLCDKLKRTGGIINER